jgi:hypothetical protein
MDNQVALCHEVANNISRARDDVPGQNLEVNTMMNL